MKNKRFGKRCAWLYLIVLFLLSILMVKFYIEDSYAHMQASGTIGTPSPIGIFVFAGMMWVASIVLFLVMDLLHAVIAHGDEGIVPCFFKDLGSFLLRMLLYWPLLIPAMYIGAYFVRL